MEAFNLLNWFESLRLVWAVAGLCLALVSGVLIWRVRGLLNWKRSQRQELAELRRWRKEADPATTRALDTVIAACESIWRSTSPDLGQIREIPDYLRGIAACYHPDEPHPELCISIGQLLTAARQIAENLQLMLERPGFERLGRLRLRQLRRTYEWYHRFNQYRIVQWIMARRRALSAIWHGLRFVLPDPLSWIAYLSQRLTIVMAGRCLLVDVYLSTGKVAIKTFSARNQSVSVTHDEKDVADILAAYETELNKEPRPMPASLSALRNELTGLPARLWNPPGIVEWRDAVQAAAHIIAESYFPVSPAPLEEATCQVLLDRSRYWIQTMAAARRQPMLRPLYGISLKRLMQIKAMTESDLMMQTGRMASGVWRFWRWAKWPVKVFRWIRRRSPAGMAVDVGITLASKAALNFLARYGFDRACQDLDYVYRHSSTTAMDDETDKKRISGTPADAA